MKENMGISSVGAIMNTLETLDKQWCNRCKVIKSRTDFGISGTNRALTFCIECCENARASDYQRIMARRKNNGDKLVLKCECGLLFKNQSKAALYVQRQAFNKCIQCR